MRRLLKFVASVLFAVMFLGLWFHGAAIGYHQKWPFPLVQGAVRAVEPYLDWSSASRALSGSTEAPGCPSGAAHRFSFGAVADPQFASIASRGDQHFSSSLWKLREAIDTLNESDLEFVVTLGDIIEEDWSSYRLIMPKYERLRHEAVFVLGNHDYYVEERYFDRVPSALGLDQRHYAFDVENVRFIVLDGNEISTFANPPGSANHDRALQMIDGLRDRSAPNAFPGNGGMGDEQLAWLDAELRTAAERGQEVIVFSHYPVYPEGRFNLLNDHAVLDILSGHEHVLAYLNGHNHWGGYGERDGIHFVTIEGMVETRDRNAYAMVHLHEGCIHIEGFGRVPSRTLDLRAPGSGDIG
jgi:predicted phosphodiesterase